MPKLVGYSRISVGSQALSAQHTDLLSAGVHRDHLYTDENVSGTEARRPELELAVAALRRGDTLVVTALDRLSRTTSGLAGFPRLLLSKGAGLRVLDVIGTDPRSPRPEGEMLLTMMASLTQMELDLREERFETKRIEGKDLGGLRKQFTRQQIETAQKMLADGKPATKVAKELRMSRSTLYKRIAKLPGSAITPSDVSVSDS